MSTHAEAHDHGHGHGGNGGDHVPHVLPLKNYLATWGTLLVLTVVTVGASYLDLGRSTNLAIALLIATIKALVVAAVFMHLRYDHKFHSIILFSAFLFLGIFITFTMFDTESRGRAESVEADRPKDSKAPFAKAAATSTAVAAPMLPQDPEANTVPPAANTAPPGATATPTDPPSGSPSANPTGAPSVAPSAPPSQPAHGSGAR